MRTTTSLNTFLTMTRLLALLWLVVVAPLSRADSESLWPLLASQQQASGRFIQELFDDKGELLERSSGRYAVLRPAFFRWDIEYPDRQQILLARDELWHYDMDLEAVTKRKADEGNGFTPLELLGGQRAELEPRFSVEELAADRYRLTPRFAGAGFSGVDLTWESGEIVAMEIRDRSGQLIRLAMTPDLEARALTADDFELDLPADVEVYGDNTR